MPKIADERIRTLNMIVINDAEAPDDFIQQQIVEQCAKELVSKLFEHNKIKTAKRNDGKFAHYVSVDIIVPERQD